MADDDKTTIPVTTPPSTDNPGSNPDTGDATDWQKEAEKWKGLSRKHEDNWKDASKRLTDLEKASMSDAEKAVANAKAEGEKSGINKAATRIATAELKAFAAEKGVKLPDLEALNLLKFVGEDGEPDEKAIAKFIDSLGAGKGAFAPASELGIGQRNSSTSDVKQLTRDELKKLSHADRVEARQKGMLRDLLGDEM